MRIGLTGGIGSGKSTVAAALVEFGGMRLIDTDAISRALTLPGGAAMPAIAAQFGPAFVAADGALDRAAMRELAFRDPAAKRALEAILHPLIGAETARQAALAAPGQALLFDVPLLVEQASRTQRRAAADAVLYNDGITLPQLRDEVRRLLASPLF